MKSVSEEKLSGKTSNNGTTPVKSISTAKKTPQSKSSSKPKVLSIEERKERFDQLHALVQKHNRMKKTKDKLMELLNSDDPVEDKITLCITAGESKHYISEFDFKTSNRVIVEGTLKFLQEKVEEILEQLDEEIIAADI